MKKLFVFVIFAFIFQSTNAQENGRIYKKFKVDVSLGYAIPQKIEGTGTSAGALFVIEPKYAVMEQVAIGLRMEAAIMAKIDIDGEKGNAKANASYLATGDYYFSNKKLRPFGGVGAGIFTFASVSDKDENIEDIPVDSKFGFMARGGIEYGHFRAGVEYNFVADKAGYLGLKLGVCIGGGRK